MRWGKYGVSNYEYSSNRLDLKLPFKTNTNFVILFIATAMLLTSTFVINDAFAINAVIIKNPYENNLPTELKWQMVFISSDSACSNYHYQMLNTYYDIALQYLQLYELENISYDPLCITEKKYLLDYENPTDLDLLILVYDKHLGEKELHANQIGGLYTHSGIDRTQNHVIIICDCPNFDYSTPPWILSHELSHFILYYKDFEMSVIERLIHVTDEKHDQCLEQSTTCKSSSIKVIAGPGGYGYSVMPIYQPAVGVKTENGGTVNSFSNNAEISKIITQWWATDIISDEQFSNAIGYLVDSNLVSSHDAIELVLMDEPFDDKVNWKQMMEEITPTYWAHEPKSDDESMPYLSKIPSNMMPNDENPLLTAKNFGLPEWFKETASLWGQDMITDTEFNKNLEYLVKQGIIETHSSNVFQDLIIESNSLPASTSIQTTSNEKNIGESLSGDLVIESNSLPASTSIQTTSNEKNIDESISQDPISKESSDKPIENETEINIPINIEGVNELFEFVNSLPDIDNRVPDTLESVIIASDDGNIDLMCNNLKFFNLIVENLIDSNGIDITLGQALIAEGVILKVDLCNL